MAADLTRDEILSWPKAELHCHLDGSLRLSTLLDLARDSGKVDLLPATDEVGLTRELERIDQSTTLEEYLEWFRYSIAAMQSPEALRRVAYELVEDAAAENVRYLEVRYGPVLHMEAGLSLDDVSEAVLTGLRDAEEAFGVRTGVIVCGLRDRYESASLAQAELAVRHREAGNRRPGVVAFDLAGGERGNPAEMHGAAFYHARKHLLNLTVHAGESFGPASIRQALFKCGAHRIGHGVTLGQDPDLLRYFVDRQIPLEVCPTSNVQTQVVASYEAHPVAEYVRAGVPVTINTDSRLFSHTTVTDELWLAHTRCGIPADDLREVALNGFRYAFLPHREKEAMMENVIPSILR
jgi:adenosine deaminase